MPATDLTDRQPLVRIIKYINIHVTFLRVLQRILHFKSMTHGNCQPRDQQVHIGRTIRTTEFHGLFTTEILIFHFSNGFASRNISPAPLVHPNGTVPKPNDYDLPANIRGSLLVGYQTEIRHRVRVPKADQRGESRSQMAFNALSVNLPFSIIIFLSPFSNGYEYATPSGLANRDLRGKCQIYTKLVKPVLRIHLAIIN